ncbi:peptidoglycan-binding protein [Fertoebacter nigrum]|uniref:Peptidoglycan-binding protein n=1 Tax=Fertoeibacter niger TaxID=2656921 RepID=A0A8X8GZC5_9RHOB|nr:peptidoglycan-binding domain-containing protein [Fertoeibacter niger]NUB44201.1 peptidoglycan-binding protein [Fertoeibacter niger]
MIRNAGLAAIAATTFVTAAAAPAMAGERERDFLKGVAATVVAGVIINDIKQKNRQRQQQQYVPVQRYYAPQPVYVEPRRQVVQRHYEPSIYSIPAAQTFNDYSSREKRVIQSQLARAGYYNGAIDGVWGPGTYRAVAGYARDTGQSGVLESRRSAYSFYDSLLLG